MRRPSFGNAIACINTVSKKKLKQEEVLKKSAVSSDARAKKFPRIPCHLEVTKK